MAKREKRSFDLKASANGEGAIQLGHKNVSSWPYETSDPAEIAALEAWPGAKETDTPSKATAKE